MGKVRKKVGVAIMAAVMCSAMSVSFAGVGGAAPIVSDPLADGLVGPLQFFVSPKKIVVGQSFSGTVSSIGSSGTVTDLFNDPGVDGVAWGPNDSIVYTHTDFDNSVIDLRMRDRTGTVTILADLIGYETANNPDGGQTYGLQGLTDECAALLPPDAGILPYAGILDSHPYAVTPARTGWYVADAGGNDILYVDQSGTIETVAVLPAQEPVLVTAEAAEANELPPCVVGSTFIAEPVPTDVEVGLDGTLYVSTLPGGPEDPSLGARGSVYAIKPWNGKVTRLATGLAGATNVALSPAGNVYVTQLFGDQVSRIVNGAVLPVATVSQPSGLEYANGKLYVSTESFGSGKIQTIKAP